MDTRDPHGSIWRRGPVLALLAGVATAAVTAGAVAGYWAGARASARAAAGEAALRAELHGMVERVTALERVQSLRLADLATSAFGDPDAGAADPGDPAASGPAGPEPEPEDALDLARGRLGGPGPGRWIESFEELQNTRDPARRKELALELARSPIPPLRLEGLKTLLEVDADEGLDAVRALVADADRNPRTQRVAAQGISLLAGVSGREVDDALYGFTSSAASGVQRAALRTLEQRGDPEPMRAALAAQQAPLGSRDAGTRARALREVGALRSQSAVPVIVPLLADSDSGVRIQALESLGRTGGGAPALAAVQPLLSDPVPAVRDTAVRTVQRLNRGPDDPEPDASRGRRR
jgi:hypothetical protein